MAPPGEEGNLVLPRRSPIDRRPEPVSEINVAQPPPS
jgi:hypothetical protein